MGGVIKTLIQSIQPWLWKYAWPKYIQNELVSYTNPKVAVTIKNLNLSVLIMGCLVLEYVLGYFTFKHIGIFCKNTSVVAWTYIISTLISVTAVRLLCFLALQQQERKSSPLTPISNAVKYNSMTDVPSWAFRD